MTIKSFKRLDDSAIQTNKLLGHNNGPMCRHCGSVQFAGLHFEDCILFKIRPSVILEAQGEAADHNRKNANKQILFYNDKRYTCSKQRVNRKISTRPRGKPNDRIRHCAPCGRGRLHRNGRCAGGH